MQCRSYLSGSKPVFMAYSGSRQSWATPQCLGATESMHQDRTAQTWFPVSKASPQLSECSLTSLNEGGKHSIKGCVAQPRAPSHVTCQAHKQADSHRATCRPHAECGGGAAPCVMPAAGLCSRSLAHKHRPAALQSRVYKLHKQKACPPGEHT